MTTNAPATTRSPRRRRPSGAPAPLPRNIGFSGIGWIVATATLLVWTVIALHADWALRITDRVDSAILRQIAHLRRDWLTDVLDGVNRVAMGWTMTIAAIALIVALILFRRWRDLLTFVGSVLGLELLGGFLFDEFSRPLPYDVTVIGLWRGSRIRRCRSPCSPSSLSESSARSSYPVNHARWQPRSKPARGPPCFPRLYLGVDHPFDVLVGISLPVAILLNAFRFFTPNDVFPVAYGGGRPRSRYRRSPRRGDPSRTRGSARHHRARHHASRVGRVGRFDTASSAHRGRARASTCSGSSTR